MTDGAAPASDVTAPGPGHTTQAFEERTAAVAAFLKKSLFFIGGVPKSGTTWLQTALDTHPQIACRGEGHFTSHFNMRLREAMDRYNKVVHNKNEVLFNEFPPFPTLNDDDFRFLMTNVIGISIMRAGKSREARIVGEKTPENVRFFGLLLSLFPGARFLHMVRDGRDCAVSAWFHNARVDPAFNETKHLDFSKYLEMYAGMWAKGVESGFGFCLANPGRCFTVRYEDMLRIPHEALRQILGFLGADNDPETVAACVTRTSFESMSGGRPRGEEDRGSFLRRGTPGDWRNHLTPEMDEAFLKIAGPMMTRLGYTSPGP